MKNPVKGTVLIEFAICMPVLIVLLFYVHDLVRIRRYQSQTEVVGQQIVNMIQNISQKRTDEKITISDLKNIFAAAWLTVYPGKTLYYNGKGFAFGSIARLWMYYIKGTSEGKAKCVWNYFCNPLNAKTPANLKNGVLAQGVNYGAINHSTGLEVEVSEIYSNLKIREGEVKIIVETSIAQNKDAVGQQSNSQQMFYLHLIEPKIWFGGSGKNAKDYFSSVVIFTPKPGLFDETPPS